MINLCYLQWNLNWYYAYPLLFPRKISFESAELSSTVALMRPLEHYLTLIKTQFWSIKCKWIGARICVWKQSSYRELSRLINVSAASPQHSWRFGANFHLASRWNIRSNKDYVESQKIWSGTMARPARGDVASARSAPAAAAASPLGLRFAASNFALRVAGGGLGLLVSPGY